jgi:hypothetical protein
VDCLVARGSVVSRGKLSAYNHGDPTLVCKVGCRSALPDLRWCRPHFARRANRPLRFFDRTCQNRVALFPEVVALPRSCSPLLARVVLLLIAVSACRENREYPLELPPQPGDGVDPDGVGAGGASGKGGSGGARAGGASGARTGGASGTTVGVRDSGPGPAEDTAVPPPVSDAAAPPPEAAPPPVSARTYSLKEVALWRGNATAAYSILHEVVCDSAFLGPLNKAKPELEKRGLTAGFAVIANVCTSANLWPKVKALADGGNEILNQGFSHACLGASAAACGMGVARSTDFAKEIGQAANELKTRVGLTEPGVFVFPYDVCSPAAITYLKSNGFLGARCGTGNMNASSFADAFSVKFDLWGPGVSGYRNGAPCKGVAADAAPTAAPAACREYILNAPLDEAIKQKGWFIRGFHGFQGDMGNYQPVAIADYGSHLDAVAAKVQAGQLWVAGPNQVVKYRFARQHCVGATLSGQTLGFPTPSADCSKYATRLSYVVATADGSDPATIGLTQAGARTAGKKVGPGTFVVEADPTKGEATLGD